MSVTTAYDDKTKGGPNACYPAGIRRSVQKLDDAPQGTHHGVPETPCQPNTTWACVGSLMIIDMQQKRDMLGSCDVGDSWSSLGCPFCCFLR
eukprot:3033104-Amphidinium_carterae.1